MRTLKPWLWPTVVLVIAVAAYNAWSVCQGHCPCENLLTLNFVTGGLLAGNGVALAALVFLRRGRGIGENAATCDCGQVLEHGWRFCGRCGQPFGSDTQDTEKM